MRFTEDMSDLAILGELGERISRQRVRQNITQANLAEKAGISKRTLERIESGDSTQSVNMIRVLRALGLIENLNVLIAESEASPMDLLQRGGGTKQRASGKTSESKSKPEWTWDDDA